MQSDVFSVIADPTRRRIVRILAEQTHTVGAVVEKLGMSQPTISKHLKVLRDANVVSVTVEGQRRLYTLNPEVFATVTEWIDETVQIAQRSHEEQVPVALPGGAHLAADADRVPDVHTAETSEGSGVAAEGKASAASAGENSTPKKAEKADEKPLISSASVAEEAEKERINATRIQHDTPSARVLTRPVLSQALGTSSASAAAANPVIPEREEVVDSTPMRPFTPVSYGYDVSRVSRPVTPAVWPASSSVTKPADPATDRSTEVNSVNATSPVAETTEIAETAEATEASAAPHTSDPTATVGDSAQPVTSSAPESIGESVHEGAEASTASEESGEAPEVPSTEEKQVEEEPVKETSSEENCVDETSSEETSAEKTLSETTLSEETSADSASETVEGAPAQAEQTEPSEQAEQNKSAASASSEYQTMPAYDSAYEPAQEPKEKEHHLSGLFGFLRGRRR